MLVRSTLTGKLYRVEGESTTRKDVLLVHDVFTLRTFSLGKAHATHVTRLTMDEAKKVEDILHGEGTVCPLCLNTWERNEVPGTPGLGQGNKVLHHETE